MHCKDIYIFAVIAVLVVSLSGCGKSDKQNEVQNQKTESELSVTTSTDETSENVASTSTVTSEHSEDEINIALDDLKTQLSADYGDSCSVEYSNSMIMLYGYDENTFLDGACAVWNNESPGRSHLEAWQRERERLDLLNGKLVKILTRDGVGDVPMRMVALDDTGAFPLFIYDYGEIAYDAVSVRMGTMDSALTQYYGYTFDSTTLLSDSEYRDLVRNNEYQNKIVTFDAIVVSIDDLNDYNYLCAFDDGSLLIQAGGINSNLLIGDNVTFTGVYEFMSNEHYPYFYGLSYQIK